jgi:hypothetical protein
MDISAIRSLRHPGKVLSPLWTQVVKYHVSHAFYRVRSFTPPLTAPRPIKWAMTAGRCRRSAVR